jgi:hypothetical protein
MFKLKKILNSGTNVPEPELVAAHMSITLNTGAVGTLVNGSLSTGSATTKPTHVLLKKKEKGEEYAICYRINPNMIFEVELVSENVADLLDGDSVCLYLDGTGGYSKCSGETEGGVAFINDMNGATKSGDTVYVSFA